MKLLVRHSFPCSPETFWKMYWDEDYDRMFMRDSTVDREVVEEREESDRMVRRLRFTPKQELPSPVASLIGSSKLIYEQENTWFPARQLMTWKVIPTVLPGKLDASGEFRVQPVGGGCERVVSGEITVNVRFIGGRIEAAVVDQVQKSYDRAAELGLEWLARHDA